MIYCNNTYEIAVYESIFVAGGGGGQNSIFHNGGGGGGQKEKMKINRGVTSENTNIRKIPPTPSADK